MSSLAKTIDGTNLCDIHTHLFPPAFEELSLFGPVELLNYHYLVAELFLHRRDLSKEDFFGRAANERAALIWETLFASRAPISESQQGVMVVLEKLGLDPNQSFDDLCNAWSEVIGDSPDLYVDKIFEMTGIESVVMTNDPLDATETKYWTPANLADPRFISSVRLDSFLTSDSMQITHGTGPTFEFPSQQMEILDNAVEVMQPKYLALSVGGDLKAGDPTDTFIRDFCLPACNRYGLPFALMIGVKRQVNPSLGLAGDSVGACDVEYLERLVADHPSQPFLVTYLERESQYAFTVLARKFSNVIPFGVWWFQNNPFLIREITEMRLAMLGDSFVYQHSDARVLEQLIYKWQRSRDVLKEILGARYGDVPDAALSKSIERLLNGNTRDALGL